MAISVTNPTVGKFGFILNATSADASGCEVLKAGAAGQSIVVDHITINSGAAITITIGEGETDSGVTTALIGPIAMAANSSIQWDFPSGFVLTAGAALTVDASAGGAICVFAHGRVM
jgi:hypothetical protein